MTGALLSVLSAAASPTVGPCTNLIRAEQLRDWVKAIVPLLEDAGRAHLGFTFVFALVQVLSVF